jgi:hypothetical protein
MTGMIDDALRAPDGDGPVGSTPIPHQANAPLTEVASLTDAAALIEQAAGVLIFRFGVDAATAKALMQLWAAEAGAQVDAVAHALVHDICQGDRSGPTDPHVVRWLEDRLRHELPAR